ncbi:hypothetical protein [Roseinatronobacter sp. NSM]|uniref:hypothetical protein n=1 Tax=Roseinatronobacter sp. NSM TaxID=3457785 RepID=UPI004035229A
MLDQADISNETFAGAIFASVAELAGLGPGARRRLAAMITGAMPGNKDRGIYALCAAIQEAECDTDLGTLLNPRQTALSPLFAAFLNYLATTVGPDELDLVARHCLRLGVDRSEAARKSAVSALGALLYRHRRDTFATKRRWKHYKALRGFLAAQDRTYPCDTDALSFWLAFPTREGWGQIKGCVDGFINLDQSLRDKGVMHALHNAEPLTAPGIAEAALEPVEGITLPEETLGAALDSFAQSPIKPFKDVELVTLDVVFRMGLHAKVWPETAECRLRYAPLQAILVQAQRDGSTSNMDGDMVAERLQSPATLRDRLRSWSRHCEDLLYLALKLHPDLCKGGNGGDPGAEADRKKRLANLQRRSAFEAMSEGDLACHLMALVPALVATRDHLSAVVDRLNALGADTIKHNDDRFTDEVLRRYGLERTGQDGKG